LYAAERAAIILEYEMNKVMKIVGATALLVGSGFATVASADVSTMTCGEFAALSDVGRKTAGNDLLMWINDTANFASTASLGGYFPINPPAADASATAAATSDNKGWTDDEMKIEIEAHCMHMMPDVTVLERLKTHT
jgi:hypothetical protein